MAGVTTYGDQARDNNLILAQVGVDFLHREAEGIIQRAEGCSKGIQVSLELLKYVIRRIVFL